MPKMFGMSKDQIAEFKEFDKAAGVEGPFNPIRRLAKFAASLAIERAKTQAEKDEKEFDDAKAQTIADSIIDKVGEGTLLDWLKNGGFAMIVEMIFEALKLFLL